MSSGGGGVPGPLLPLLLLLLALPPCAARVIVNRSIPDVCATCHIHATCQQSGGKSVCICNYGFVGNGRTHCQDKDECQIGASKICGNHTLCHNTHGSFYCVCLDGYRASNNNKTFIPNDGTNCTDVDECEESGLCGHNARCVNTEGSYMCYCNDGYKLETGERSFRQDGNVVSCKEIGCGSPPEMKHGYIVGNYSLLPGSAVHYECQEGFYSNEGKFSYCTANATWEPATLSCKGVDCGVPPSVLNARPTSVSGTTYRSEVTYGCVRGYLMAGGSGTAVCNAKGQWDGPDLVCKETDCGKPLLIPHTTMTWDNSTTLGSRVYYHCKEGYYFNGDRNFSECTIDQSWENIAYVCKDIGPAPDLTWDVQDPRRLRQPDESIISWLVRLWDAAGEVTILDGTEARHLGSLSHDPVIDQGMMSRASPHSLWEWVLDSVAQRYLCVDDLYIQQTPWKTIEQGIQRLREMAVAELIFSDDITTRNPDQVPCTPVMWRKLVRLGPPEYASALAILKRDDIYETVLDMAKKLRAYADAVHGPTHARIAAVETRLQKLEDKIEENHKKLREEIKEDLIQISAVQIRGP
ncbi:sushi domain-containing protein 1-like, partial [Onychostruthus taczanowskii]|uniref:sushi domain-containing protein 1-like n=1 Tax=Onychostruthus taczanowskii TaxID=356909 RepID=UPI001B8024DF